MDQPRSPAAEYRCRRGRCLALLARARDAPPAGREGLLVEAALVAAVHEELTGTPLLYDLEARLSAVRRLPPAPG